VLLTRIGHVHLIDKNGDGDTADAGEKTTITAVLGGEPTTGNAPDFADLDQTQVSANNVLDLGPAGQHRAGDAARKCGHRHYDHRRSTTTAWSTLRT
jgi:hypothetical protein